MDHVSARKRRVVRSEENVLVSSSVSSFAFAFALAFAFAFALFCFLGRFRPESAEDVAVAEVRFDPERDRVPHPVGRHGNANRRVVFPRRGTSEFVVVAIRRRGTSQSSAEPLGEVHLARDERFREKRAGRFPSKVHSRRLGVPPVRVERSKVEPGDVLDAKAK